MINLGQIEKFGPFIIAAVVFIAAAVYVEISDTTNFPEALPLSTMTFGIVVVGFAATQRNMMIGMGGSRVMQFIIRNRQQDRVLGYFMHCVSAGLAVTIVSMAGFFVDGFPRIVCIMWLSLLISLVALIITLIGRNEWVMRVVTKRYLEEGNDFA